MGVSESYSACLELVELGQELSSSHCQRETVSKALGNVKEQTLHILMGIVGRREQVIWFGN